MMLFKFCCNTSVLSNIILLNKVKLFRIASMLIILLIICHNLYSQSRYTSRTFENICVEKNVTYCTADSWDLTGTGTLNPSDIKLDIYYPIESATEKRPLVLCLFGGAFLSGSKERPDIVAWCDSLAHYGYVAVAINYRLGFNPVGGGGGIGPSTGMKRAAYRAIQDCRSAIHFLIENSEMYRIDTSQIFLLGNSAGAITAINTVFFKDEERFPETYSVGVGQNNSDLGDLDCNSYFPNHNISIAGVVSLWGATMDLSWFDEGEQVPMLFIHGDADEIVPYNEGYAFNYGNNTNVNVYLYGSEPIYQIFEQNNWQGTIHIYANQPHAFYSCGEFNMTNLEREYFPCEYWDTIFPEVVNWLCTYNNDCNSSSIEDYYNDGKYKIYPNPANSVITLSINEDADVNYVFTIYNCKGELVYQTIVELAYKHIDISNFIQGIYFTELRNGNGRYTSKLIVE
jgi:pimeloyl-ACP methyl ester carboxylesterase